LSKSLHVMDVIGAAGDRLIVKRESRKRFQGSSRDIDIRIVSDGVQRKWTSKVVGV
jgi:hypothetical protein